MRDVHERLAHVRQVSRHQNAHTTFDSSHGQADVNLTDQFQFKS